MLSRFSERKRFYSREFCANFSADSKFYRSRCIAVRVAAICPRRSIRQTIAADVEGFLYTGGPLFRALRANNRLVYYEAQFFGVDDLDYEGRILGVRQP